MKSAKGLAAILFMASCALGTWLSQHSWRGLLFVYIGEERAPAALRKVTDYSSLEPKALNESVNKQMLADAQFIVEQGRLAISLGHPIVAQNGGAHDFGCQVQERSGLFDKIELSFVGVGISQSGEMAKMTVEAPCRSKTDINRLETIYIPVDEIFSGAARDQDLQYYGDLPTRVILQSIPGQWPDSWVLWTVRLSSERNPDQSLFLDSNKVKEAQPRLLSFPTSQAR